MMIVASNQECHRTALHNASRANGNLLIPHSNRFRTSLPQPALEVRPFCSEVTSRARQHLWHTYAPKPCKDVLDDILARNPSAFTDEARPELPIYQALACRIWIQGQGIAAGRNVKAGLKSALVFLGQRSNETSVSTVSARHHWSRETGVGKK